MSRKDLILYLQREWDVPKPLPGLSRKSIDELRALMQELLYIRSQEADKRRREEEQRIYDWFVNHRQT